MKSSTVSGRLGQSGKVQPGRSSRHPASWWSQFQEVSDRFDAASVTEVLADEIVPKISNPLLRREAEIATEVVVRHLNKVSSPELAERAAKATARLIATVERLNERATNQDLTTAETAALVHALQGRYAEAASEAEPFVGTVPLIKAFVAALRLEYFDVGLTVKLIGAGQGPSMAVQTGLTIGRYGWWPDWLLKIVADRAMSGRLDKETIAALDRCAYAELSPAQSRIARRILNGDRNMIEASASRLEDLGEVDAAAKLRQGDLTAVALAARLIPL
ncbi:hypothetical protein [Actinoplanes sp. NPDC051411]|uniref:hypothetical protein n=1 Tax=Actinoplanes sp. NPDC051411 TaxID=3155522 RepID=UPI00341A665E